MFICLFKMILFLLFFITNNNTYAGDLICPPGSLVKQVTFIHATKNPHDNDSWNLQSQAFLFNGMQWNVVFGTFLPHANTMEQALEQGQAYFEKSSLEWENPLPDELPNQIILCDYMPTGRLYWVSALSPPEY